MNALATLTLTRCRILLLLVFTLLLASGSALAQEFRGTISGAVTDPTGAAVPGAAIVVKEIHTGTLSRTKSDADGQYVVPFLLPGDYQVTVTEAGFDTEIRNNIGLESQAHPIVNLQLKVGSSGETVEVNAAPPLIDQANASVGQVITTQSVEDLPLNGRTPTTLTELSEGVITTAAPQIVHPFDNNAGNSWSIGGTPNQVSEVLLDGAPDLTLLGALAYAPTEDSVSEISVRPFDTDASFGHTIGGVINQVTKSGTNALHGSLYEFAQISNLDANTYFNDRANPVPRLPVTHFNQYGLTVGGPVLIPRIYNGKDKLFFFFAFEGLKDSTPNTYTTTVPTAAERTGDLSIGLFGACNKGLGGAYTVNPATGIAYCNDSPATPDPNQLYNPFTAKLVNNKVVRSALPNNQLTAAGVAFNPVALAYLNLFPQPNNSAGLGPDGTGNYITNAPSIDDYNNEFGRLDFNASSRDHVFFDMRHNYRTQTKNVYFGNNTTGTTLLRENFGLTADNVFTLNPTTIFDTRINWTFFNEVHGAPSQSLSPSSVGLPSALTAKTQLAQLPCITFTTSSSSYCGTSSEFQTLGDNGSALDPTTSYQIFTDMVKLIGQHSVKIGFDGRQYRISIQNFANSSGAFNFGPNFVESGTGGAAQNFGGDFSDFLFGLPTAGDFDVSARADYHQYYVGAFVQDDWRVSNKLTLNLGLRYDVDTPFRDKFGRTVSGFDPAATNGVSGKAATKFAPVTVTANGSSFTLGGINTLGGLTFPSGHNGAPFKTQNNGFLSPRVGFSYSPTGRTVVRGGFGIFVQPETLTNLNAAGSYSSAALNNQEGFSASTTYTATSNNYLTPPTSNNLSNPFPNGINQPVGSSLGASTYLGQAISFLAPVEHDIYSERWDFGVQHSLTNNTLVEALYVGNHGLHLPISSQNLNATQRQYLTSNPYRDETLASEYGTSVANPFAGLLPNGGGLNGSTVSVSSLLVPYPEFGTITEENQTIGQSYFDSAILHVEQRERHGLTLTANYSFSKLVEADTFLNDQDTTPTRRISPFDHTHHFTVGSTYDLPLGRGKAFSFGGNRLWDEVFGGFVLNAIYQFQTGPPVEFSADIPLAAGATFRSITNSPRNTSPVGSTPALSISKFVTGNSTSCPSNAPCDGTGFINGQYSNHYRTLPQTLSWVRADGFNNLDASVLKDLHFTEKTYLQLRFETFNTLNHPVFASPNVSSATAANFGFITSTYANSQPRQVQLGARIVF